jgi:hypothetical protein
MQGVAGYNYGTAGRTVTGSNYDSASALAGLDIGRANRAVAGSEIGRAGTHSLSALGDPSAPSSTSRSLRCDRTCVSDRRS